MVTQLCCHGNTAVLSLVMVTQCCRGYTVLSWLHCVVMVTQLCCHGNTAVLSWLHSVVVVTLCCHGYTVLSW